MGLVAWLMLFTLGLVGYSGSKIAYALFSMATGAMLLTGLRQTTSYGYLFLKAFLWLGFWLKLTIHTVLSYPFVEPAVGSFLGGAGAWDEVLNTASVASLGVMLGMAFFSVAVLAVEFFINVLTANPIICSLYGAVVASNIAQFGGSPRESAPYIFMLTCGILLIWIVRSNFFALALQKLRMIKTAESNGI